MELNAEINRVIGTEMARLMSEKIGEEEMKEKAMEVWTNMNKKEYQYGSYKDSEIEKYIKNVILDRLYGKINEILKEPINEEALEKKAREMVEKARKAGEEAIVKAMANHMAHTTLSAYDSQEQIVLDVLATMNMQNSRGY